MRPQDLLNRLAAGYEYDPMYGALCNERDKLKAENAKLRELVRDLYYETKSPSNHATKIEIRMSELGIEVSS